MKTMKRNQTTIYYAKYEGLTDKTATDEWGNVLKSGESVVNYSEPIAIDLVVSASTGMVAEELFGSFQDYDKILFTEKGCEIDENSILWIDVTTDEPYDYVVKKVARSLNFVAYAISRVEVGYGNNTQSK